MGLALLVQISTFLRNYLTFLILMAWFAIPKEYITTRSTLTLMVSTIFLAKRICATTVHTFQCPRDWRPISIIISEFRYWGTI